MDQDKNVSAQISNEDRDQLKSAPTDRPRQEETATSRTLSFGEKAVGISFNPGGHPVVNKIKRQFADMIDVLNDLRNTTAEPEVKRMCSVAITEAQTAQMWGVKAATWS